MQQGLDYKFKLADIGKYSQRLNYKDMDWKMKRSALGKIVPNEEERRKKLAKASHF